MEKKLYILRTDRPGKIVARTKFQKIKEGISENVLKSSLAYSALKGDIYEESPSEEQPSDDQKISVVSVEDDTKVLEVETADLAKLTETEANLLLAIPTSKERFEIFRSRNILERAAALQEGDKMKVKVKSWTTQGKLKYKGKLLGKRGIHFGLELNLPYGDTDGTIQGKRYFTAIKGYGIFASVNMLILDQNTKKPKESIDQTVDGVEIASYASSKKTPRLQQFDNHCGLTIGMRVVAFSSDHKDNDNVLRGVIRFIGKADSDKDVVFGIELDTPDGSGDGKYKGERVFQCRQYHAVFTTADFIMKEQLYNEGSVDTYVVLTHEDENAQHHRVKAHRSKSFETATKHDSLTDEKSTKNYHRKGNHDYLLKNLAQLKNDKLVQQTDEILNKTEDGRHRRTNSDYLREQQQEILNNVQKGPQSLSFCEDHFATAEKRNRESNIKSNSADYRPQGVDKVESYTSKSKSDGNISDWRDFSRDLGYRLPSYDEIIGNDNFSHDHQASGSNFIKSPYDKDYDLSLQVDSVVEVNIKGIPHYGVIRWKGVPDGLQMSEPIVGLELEQPYEFGTDGSFHGKRYFSCPTGRGFFVKLSSCKRDSRFLSSLQSPVRPVVEQVIEEIPGIYLPVEKTEDIPIGQMRGIQGHHNSCYLDSTLFAMFAFSVVFDMILHREKRSNDIQEYDEVRRVLKETVVNPLRSKGFVNAGSVLQLRKWLDRLGSVQGFMNEEKDPEEFLMLLFRDVLKVDPFIRLRTENDTIQSTYFYQIWVDKDEDNPLPSLQYLIEQSFLTGNLRLEEVPSVFIVQLPRFGMQKIYKRIRLNSHLDISKVMSSAVYNCLICERKAIISCKECCHSFGWKNPFVYLCNNCNKTVHQHSSRRGHQPKQLKASHGMEADSVFHTLELFAIVCIKTSHYVTFAKCGTEPNEKWLFFDSMADRKGGQNGQNIPEVVECPEVSQWFNEKPLKFTESDHKNTPEKILRLFEDASLCLYRSNELSIYG